MRLIVSSLILSLLIATGCRSSKVEYLIFDGLKPEDKAFIMASVESGKGYFKQSCAKCHGILKKGKKDITNFSKEALHDYQSSFLAGDPENHAVIDKLTEQQLSDILLFITFVKKD